MELREYKALHAEWYELRSAEIDHSREINYWATCIGEAGEPALELGSGTGRVLISLLERGLDVVGVDNSPAMTKRCVAACDTKGLTPQIYNQSMLELDLGRRFALIFLDSGGLGLFADDRAIATLFERVIAHLKPGGTFIYEFQPVPTQPRDDTRRTEDRAEGPDGVLTASRTGRTYDATSGVWKERLVLKKFVGGELVQTEANDRTGRFFTIDEAVELATAAGFEIVRATDWLTDDPPTGGSTVVTVRCRSTNRHAS